jgi:translation initiation factor 3 subunit C
MIQRQHNLSEPVPAFYVRTLVNLELSINTTLQKEKEAKKKMNASNAKALTAMKQKIKKAVKENETDVKKFTEVSGNTTTIMVVSNMATEP